MLTADSKFENIMSEKVKEWFEKYASTAEEGFYQVPDDVFHYTCVGTDIDGLSLYRSKLGTNMNKNLHSEICRFGWSICSWTSSCTCTYCIKKL